MGTYKFRPEREYADWLKQIRKTVEPKVMPKPGPEREQADWVTQIPNDQTSLTRKVYDIWEDLADKRLRMVGI